MVELMTAEDLVLVDIPGKTTELVRGQLVVREPPSAYHGRIAANLTLLVGTHVRAHALGAVFVQDSGFRIASDPDTVRAADLAFVTGDRLHLVGRRGYPSLAPDLVAEILSPGDRPAEVLAKVAEWLASGVRLVWVIDPDAEEARVFAADGGVAIVGRDGVLEGVDVIPGLQCSLAEILAT
jgi:Uma2 family endonuclease